MHERDRLGLDADEGPYYQTLRFERYKEVLAQMLSAGARVDFYVWTGFNRDDSPGGVTVDARITAE